MSPEMSEEQERYRKSRIEDFNHSEFARLLGMVVKETWDGGARVAMDVTGKRNSLGNVHGGAIFSLADHAFGLAANLEEVQVATSAHINYLSPAGDHLEAVAERVAGNDLNSLFRVTVYEGERVIATFEGVGIRMKRTK
jgi:acyl-CoA thioesterase